MTIAMDKDKAGKFSHKYSLSICAVLAIVAATIYAVHSYRVIGCYYGAEAEYIRIGNDVYELDGNDPYTSSDRGMRMGRVVSERNPSAESMYIWSVKGTDEYIYRVWGFCDGGFYRKVGCRDRLTNN